MAEIGLIECNSEKYIRLNRTQLVVVAAVIDIDIVIVIVIVIDIDIDIDIVILIVIVIDIVIDIVIVIAAASCSWYSIDLTYLSHSTLCFATSISGHSQFY